MLDVVLDSPEVGQWRGSNVHRDAYRLHPHRQQPDARADHAPLSSAAASSPSVPGSASAPQARAGGPRADAGQYVHSDGRDSPERHADRARDLRRGGEVKRSKSSTVTARVRRTARRARSRVFASDSRRPRRPGRGFVTLTTPSSRGRILTASAARCCPPPATVTVSANPHDAAGGRHGAVAAPASVRLPDCGPEPDLTAAGSTGSADRPRRSP